jgi:hypothetical protein
MYPILEYSRKYLILEYYAYFHTYTLYIYPVFVLSIYMYILIVSVYTILLHTDSFNTLLIENRTTLSICDGVDTHCWCQNQWHHHLHRQHLAHLCVGPVHRCVSVSPMWHSTLEISKYPSWGRGCHGLTLSSLYLVAPICSYACCVSTNLEYKHHPRVWLLLYDWENAFGGSIHCTGKDVSDKFFEESWMRDIPCFRGDCEEEDTQNLKWIRT